MWSDLHLLFCCLYWVCFAAGCECRRTATDQQIELLAPIPSSKQCIFPEQRTNASLHQASEDIEAKSIELLKSWLDPKQLKQFNDTGKFDVIGS